MNPIRTTRTRALALVAITSLALTACGRDSGGGGAEGQGEAIEEGKATGTIEVWAMGTEGEVLGDFSAAFMDENPDADVEGHRRPLGRRARQDRQRHRGRGDPRRDARRQHLDG